MLAAFVVLASLLIFAPSQGSAQSTLEKTDATPCRIEDWRWAYNDTIKAVHVQGATTCSSAHVIMRAYTKAGEEAVYLGNLEAYSEGHAFEAYLTDVQDEPESLSVKYTIGGE